MTAPATSHTLLDRIIGIKRDHDRDVANLSECLSIPTGYSSSDSFMTGSFHFIYETSFKELVIALRIQTDGYSLLKGCSALLGYICVAEPSNTLIDNSNCTYYSEQFSRLPEKPRIS